MSWKDYCFGTVRVRYIDVLPWKGLRHDRLRRIWQAIAQWQDHFWVNPGCCYRLWYEPYENSGKKSHTDCLERMWKQERWHQQHQKNRGYKFPVRYTVITEMDFLPNLTNWLRLALAELAGSFMLAPVKQRTNAGDTEVWFNMVDWKMWHESWPELRWEHPHDPGADLHEQLPMGMVKHYKGRLGTGGERDHLGWEYPFGVHLLGSRHLEDPPGIPLWEHQGRVILTEELQANHDAAVSRWISEQPKTFQELLKGGSE